MSILSEVLSSRLQARKEQGLYRERVISSGPFVITGKKVLPVGVDFASNNYLGLANHPLLIEAWKQGLDKYGAGSTGSSLVTGYSDAHADLENAVAEFTGRDRAVIFVSGYAANLSVLQALVRREDLLIADKLVHASLLDGIQLSRGAFHRFAHAETRMADALFSRACRGSKYLLTEGVFSMDGDIADLAELVPLCDRHSASLILDDAHALGVLGTGGGGSCEHFGLDAEQVPVLTGGFGKAVGVAGGFVAGCRELTETIIQFARPYIYSTAMPPAQAVALTRAIGLLRQFTDRRERLTANIILFRLACQQWQVPLMDSQTAIQPVLLGDTQKTMRVAELIRQDGYQVIAIRPPTVPVNGSRLRITLSSEHSTAQIEALVKSLARAIKNCER